MNAVTPSGLADPQSSAEAPAAEAPASDAPASDAPASEPGAPVCASMGEPLDMTDDEQDAFQLRSLDVIVAAGARLARLMEAQIVEANWIAADGPLLFETLARTMRRTVALQRRISEERRSRRRERVVARKAQVRRVVTTAIEDKVAPGPDATPSDRERLGVEREDLLRDLKERLDDTEFETMVLLPVFETVVLICREMDVPVPEPWAAQALAAARAEIAARAKPPKPPPLPSLSVPWRPPFVSSTDPPTAL